MITIDEGPDTASLNVADIALAFPQAMRVLNSYNLDYCCNGKRPFTTACADAGLNAEEVLNQILVVKENSGVDDRMKFDTWEPTLLVDFILQHHHAYVRESMPRIKELLAKVCEDGG